MGARTEEAAARAERARAIGLFRYGLIREAADPGLSTRARGRLVRAVAAAEHTDPTGRQVRVSRDTLDRWDPGVAPRRVRCAGAQPLAVDHLAYNALLAEPSTRVRRL